MRFKCYAALVRSWPTSPDSSSSGSTAFPEGPPLPLLRPDLAGAPGGYHAMVAKICMKTNMLMALALLTTAGLLTARADAASAIAIDPYGHLTRAYDPFDTVEEARARALDLAFKHGWMSARIVASTSRYGECAIAIAYTRDGEIIGISLGQCTEAEADVRAIASCIRQGGFYPRVYCRFKG
jgi:hypothetical protein